MRQRCPIQRIPFYFVRHGETVGNVRSLCQGRIDFPLTERGERQARAAGESLQGRGIVRIATSPLARARSTTRIIAEVLGLSDVAEHHGLIERGWGELEGQHNSFMFAQEERERMPSYTGVSDIKGIETKEELLTRIASAMNDLLVSASPLAIVGHGRFFNGLCELLNVPPIEQIGNGAPVHCVPGRVAESWEISSL